MRFDYAGSAPFRQMGYIPEALMLRCRVAWRYADATGETPWGEVDALYTDALAESKKYKSVFTKWIQDDYDRYLKSRAS